MPSARAVWGHDGAFWGHPSDRNQLPPVFLALETSSPPDPPAQGDYSVPDGNLEAWFHAAHTVGWEAIIVLAVVGLWLAWAAWVDRAARPHRWGSQRSSSTSTVRQHSSSPTIRINAVEPLERPTIESGS